MSGTQQTDGEENAGEEGENAAHARGAAVGGRGRCRAWGRARRGAGDGAADGRGVGWVVGGWWGGHLRPPSVSSAADQAQSVVAGGGTGAGGGAGGAGSRPFEWRSGGAAGPVVRRRGQAPGEVGQRVTFR
ncbi:hypothetical protein GCM10010260_65470 [Streptomyces filipinensis]|uniref:Uncharacterized protein n=1 Tax=Streptomyces filipinensis TaxID=66887 RepID=A0A918MEY2_9ACTN|nr:hypothetical protein GCM10010260_65470 [Streptomyces filipinensis]